MWLRFEGAKRSMRKHFAPTCHCRPTLDRLEDRCLLSGGIEVIIAPPPPALVIGVGMSEILPSPNFPGALAFSARSSGPESWQQMSVLGFHRDFSPRWSSFPSPAGLRPSFDPQLAIPPVSGVPGGEDATAPPSTMIPSGVVPPTIGHGDVPPAAMSPPFQGPASVPIPVFIDLQHIRLNEALLHTTRDPSARSLLDEATMGSPGNVDYPQGIAIPFTSGHVIDAAVGGNSITQIASPAGATSTYVTTLPSSEVSQNYQSIRAKQTDGSSSNQLLETFQKPLPKITLAKQVVSDVSTAATMVGVRRGGDAVMSPTDPTANGDQEKVPLPQAAGLIADSIPFDRASLEQAVDQFFDRLEDLGVGQLVDQESTHLLPLSLTLLGMAIAVEVARRRLRSTTGQWMPTQRQDPLGSEELLGFPELPGSWSTRVT